MVELSVKSKQEMSGRCNIVRGVPVHMHLYHVWRRIIHIIYTMWCI